MRIRSNMYAKEATHDIAPRNKQTTTMATHFKHPINPRKKIKLRLNI